MNLVGLGSSYLYPSLERRGDAYRKYIGSKSLWEYQNIDTGTPAPQRALVPSDYKYPKPLFLYLIPLAANLTRIRLSWRRLETNSLEMNASYYLLSKVHFSRKRTGTKISPTAQSKRTKPTEVLLLACLLRI